MRRAILAASAATLLLGSCDEERIRPLAPVMTDSVGIEAAARGTSAIVAWTTTFRDLDGFSVDRSLGDTLHWFPTLTFGPGDWAWTDTGTTPDVDRWYRVRALRSGAVVGISRPARCRPAPRPGEADTARLDTLSGEPPTLAAFPDSQQIVLAWSAPSRTDLDGWIVERSVGDTLGFAVVAYPDSARRNWIDTTAKKAGIRWYRVRMRKAHAASRPSRPVQSSPLVREVAWEFRRGGAGVDTLELPWGWSEETVYLANLDKEPLRVTGLRSTRPWLRLQVEDTLLPVGGARILRLSIDTTDLRGSGSSSATIYASVEATTRTLVVSVADPPRARPALRVDSAGTRWVALGWNTLSADAFARALVQRSTAPGGPFAVLDTVRDEARTAWNDLQAPGGDSSFYRLVVVDTSGDTVVSNVARAFATSRASLVFRLVDAVGSPVAGRVASASGDTLATDASGRVAFHDPHAADSSWMVSASGRVGRRMRAKAPADGAETLQVVLDPLPEASVLPGLEGTDLYGAVLQRDTAWAVDRAASGSVLLAGVPASGTGRSVRRTLGQIVSIGTPGPSAKSGGAFATSLPLVGALSVARVPSGGAIRAVLPDTAGAPWGVAACPDGGFAVAGASRTLRVDSAGRVLDAWAVGSVVDDVGSTGGGRVACTGGRVLVADAGGKSGLASIDRSSGTVASAGFGAAGAARYLAVDTGWIAVGVVASSGSASLRVLSPALAPVASLDLGAGLVGIAVARGRDGQTLVAAAMREGGGGRLLLVDPTATVVGEVALPIPPVDLAAEGGRILVLGETSALRIDLVSR